MGGQAATTTAHDFVAHGSLVLRSNAAARSVTSVLVGLGWVRCSEVSSPDGPEDQRSDSLPCDPVPEAFHGLSHRSARPPAFKRDPKRHCAILSRLNGQKFRVIGNHDDKATLELKWAALVPLEEVKRAYGSGVDAIYYRGDLRHGDADYVGKADPEGRRQRSARAGRQADGPTDRARWNDQDRRGLLEPVAGGRVPD
jgi:hypothetical protein